VPVANLEGTKIHYEVMGDAGPWVALVPGGREPARGLRPLGERIAREGFRVITHDKRGGVTSDAIGPLDGRLEELWADDLHALLASFHALPSWVGGVSAGARVALVMALRHPEAVRGLLLWRTTGGVVPESIRTKRERDASTGLLRRVLSSVPGVDRRGNAPESRGELPDIGASEDEFRSITAPVCIVPGYDAIHPLEASETLHRLLPYSVLRHAKWPWSEYAERLAEVFVEFMREHAEAGPPQSLRTVGERH
jgi:pimeloyl-ACP methyl ester carboxylesterase